MAEDKNIKIKIDVEGNALDKTEQLSGSIKGVKSEAKSSVETFGLMDTGLGKMAKGVIAFGKKGVNAMRTFKGAVISTGIGALVIAVVALVQYFTKSERGAMKLKVIFAAVGQVVNTVVDTFIKIGETIGKVGKVIGKIFKGTTTLKDGMKEMGEVGKQANKELADSWGGLNDRIKESISLQERENQLVFDRRKNIVQEATLTVQLAQAKERIDDATLSNVERLKSLSEATELQNKISDERIRIAKEEYEIMKAQEAQNESDTETKDALAQKEAELILLEAERADRQKEFTAKRSAMINTQLAENQRIADQEQALLDKKKEADEKEQERLDALAANEVERARKVNEELQALNDEIYLMGLETDQERRDAQLELEQERFEEDLERRAEQNEITDDEYTAFLEASEQKYNEIKNKYREEDAIANKKALAEEEAAAKAAAKAKIEADNAVAISKLRNVTTTLSAFSDAVGEETKLGKAAAITAVLTDAAQAIIGTWAGYSSMGIAGTILAVLQTATIGITTAKSISNINSAALGGWVGGASHQNGGVTMNMEGGEYIVNKRAMQNPSIAESVMAMNAAGNGNNTGSSKILNETDVALIAASVVQAIPVQVVENDITEKQRKVQVREESYSR